MAAALLLAAVVLPAVALAHANLERAEPVPGTALDQAPHELRLYFSEAVDSSFSRVQLLNARREAVDRGDSHVAPNDPRAMIVSVPDALPNGVYTVAWRTLSAVDGHTVNGAYPLIFGPPPAEGVPATASASSQAVFAPETALARWWLYLAGGVLFGALAAWQLVLWPVLARVGAVASPRAFERSRRLTVFAAIVALAGTLYAALAQAATAGDVPLWGALGTPLADLLLRGRYATLWWPRLALLVAALVVVASRGPRGWAGRAALAATAGALLTQSLTSHAAALLSGAYLGLTIDWLHLLSASTWIGGLASLAYVLPAAVQTTQSNGDQLLARAVARFSTLGLISVAVIIGTGTFQAWLQVGSWEGLVQTLYGLSVSVKIGLLVLALVLAAFNLLVARPRLAALAGKRTSQATVLARRLALSVRGEIGLLVLVLGVASVLTGLAPAREELARRAAGDLQGGPLDRQLDLQTVRVRVQITPAALGINRFIVELPGTDAAQVERVQLTMTYLGAELGSQPLVLDRSPSIADGWETTSAVLSQAGTWQVELLVRRSAQDDARTALRFVVAGAGGAPQAPAQAAGAYPLLPSPLVSVAYVLVAGGLAVLVVGTVRAARQGKRGRRALQRQGALLGAGLLVLACGGYVYAQEQRNGVPLDVANVRDPVPPDERSLASGRETYTTYCETCHGEAGRGDGPTGLRLVPRPADLRVHTAPGVHTDGEIFYWVSYGFPNSAMPAWKDVLTEEQRWDAINYARATFGGGQQ